MYRRAQDVGFALGIAALYAATAGLGIALTRDPGVASIWLSNGLLAGILLLRSRAEWPWILAACFVVNVAVNIFTDSSFAPATGFSVANTVEVLIAALALRPSLTGVSSLGEPRVLGRFFLFAVVIAPAVSAGLGVVVALAVTDGPSAGMFSRWWTSDALGMAVMLPLVLGLRPAEVRQTLRDATWPKLAGAFALLIAANLLVFAQSRFPVLFLVMPPMLLIAFRLGYAATAAAIFITAAMAVISTIMGYGPFTLLRDLTMTQRFLALELVIAALILTSYPVCAVIARQRRLLRDMAASEERFRVIAVNSIDVITVTNERGAWTYLSPSVTEMLGWTPADLIGHDGLEHVHPEDAALYAHGIELLRKGREALAASFRMRHRDGRYVWVETISRPLRAAARARLADSRGRQPLSSDHGEPAVQRCQVLPHRRQCRSRRERPRRPVSNQRDRPWVRHSRRVPQGAVRTILASRFVGRSQPWRHGLGDGDCEAPDAADVGTHQLRVGRERGNDLPPGVPGRELRGRRGVTRFSAATARYLKSHADAD
jgi:PAS domain S-box-containing protein